MHEINIIFCVTFNNKKLKYSHLKRNFIYIKYFFLNNEQININMNNKIIEISYKILYNFQQSIHKKNNVN